MFDVGMDVVCIAGSLEGEAGPPTVKGQIYKIRAIMDLPCDDGGTWLTLWFHEVAGEVGGWFTHDDLEGYEFSTGFKAESFRPVKNTDISELTQYLAPTKKLVSV